MTTTPASGLSYTDQAAIAALPAQLVEAWQAHDADAFADLFTQDGTMILPGVYQKGRSDIREYMAEAFAMRYTATRVTGTPIDIKPLGPGAVAVITEGGILNPGEARVSPAAAIRASWILVKRDNAWSLAVYHNCPRNPE